MRMRTTSMVMRCNSHRVRSCVTCKPTLDVRAASGWRQDEEHRAGALGLMRIGREEDADVAHGGV